MEAERDVGFEREDFFALRNLPRVPSRSKTPVFGSGRRACESDLRSYLMDAGDGATVLNDASLLLEADDGRSLEGLFKRPFYIPAEIRRRNILVTGQVGSGKTEELIVPVAVSDIADRRSSLVVVDFKGDLHQKLTPFVQRYRPGRRIAVINLTDRRRTTHAWNPYSANLDAASALEDASSFCAASQTRAYNPDSAFWDGSAARWIAALLFRLRANRGTVCPADVHQALELPRAELLTLLKDGPDVPFASAVASFLDSGSHNAETVLATAQMYYRIFQDLDLASVTSAGMFQFETLFKQPTVLVLEINQGDVERVRPLLNLFFSQLFREAARYAEQRAGCRLPVPLNLLMDDFAAAMGRIPEIGQHLNLARSRDIRVMAAIQSLAQINHFYGSEGESVVSGFSTFIFKSPVGLGDAEWASQHSGTCTVEAVDIVEEPDPHFVNGWDMTQRTTRPIGRRVLLPEEIRLAPEHFLYGRASTVILPDVPVFQVWFRPAYDTPGLAEPMAQAMRTPRRRSLRRKPLEWKGTPRPSPTPNAAAQDAAAKAAELARQQVGSRLEAVKQGLGWGNTTGAARQWWQSFEQENRDRLDLVLKLAEELAQRQVTITEFFQAYTASNTDNIQANLHYLDYLRLKREHERNRRGG
jgi:hypothetical protein